MNRTKLRRLAAGILAAAALSCFAVPAIAQSYFDSPERTGPAILAGTDSAGNDLTDPNLPDKILITPYRSKDQMAQSYKRNNFDTAMQKLTREAAAAALGADFPAGMNIKYLSAESVFYIHERDDSGFFRLHAQITVSTTLKKSDYVKLLAFLPMAQSTRFSRSEPKLQLLASLDTEPDHSDYVWTNIPFTMEKDGVVQFQLDDYGAFALLTYAPVEETETTGPSGTTSATRPTRYPLSPQTGEAEPPSYSCLGPVCCILVAGALLIWDRYRKRQDYAKN